ncbi:MAG: hypothetical protein JXA58_08230 [Dehalococcoidia bacterium]|nr:hypothetical protein [Dehalococcoidia bacterium]
MDKRDLAVMAGVTSNVDLLSNDRLEALTAGHGMVNMAVWSIANVIVEERARGVDISLRFANSQSQPADDVIRKCVAAAVGAGAEAGNASLLSAVLLYLAGTPSQVGVPAGNRKLGALTRMAAGVPRCGVATIPTAKSGNKASGFPAVQAIYEAAAAGRLTEVDGRRIPNGVTPLFIGHAALGEEHAIREIALAAGRIGTEAMMDAQAGLGIHPEPLYMAIFGAAAALEIVHPDAWTQAPGSGTIEKSAFLVGKGAVQAAGLPAQLHLEGTSEVFDTATLVGDLGLILKDAGAPTVVGMLSLRDALQVFKEPVSPFRATTPPLGHICGEAVLAMKLMLAFDFDAARVVSVLASLIDDKRVDSEMAHFALNTLARKAEQVRRGPVTEMLLRATEPVRTRLLSDTVDLSREMFESGDTIEDVVMALEKRRLASVDRGSSRLLSRSMGKEVFVEVTRIAPRGNKVGPRGRWWVFDMDVDVLLTIDGVTHDLSGLAHKAIPGAALDADSTLGALVGPACLPVSELCLSAHTIINITVPAAMAAVMGLASPDEAAERAERAAFITAAFPGARARATEAAERAVAIVAALR